MHIYALVAVLSPRVQSTDARPAPLEWQVRAYSLESMPARARPPACPIPTMHVHIHRHNPTNPIHQVIAEAQAADATGNYRDIARRLVAAAAASDVPASSSPLAPSGGEAAAVVKRSYSTADGAHSFNYLVVPAPAPVVASGPGVRGRGAAAPSWLLFLCLADAGGGSGGGTTREAFRFLEASVYVFLGSRVFKMCPFISHRVTPRPHKPTNLDTCKQTLRAAVLASLTAPAAASPQAPEQPQQPPPPPPLRPTSSSLIAALKKPGGHNKTPSLSSSTSPSDYAPLSDEEPPPSMPASTGDGAVGEEEQGMEAAVRRGFWQAARQYYLVGCCSLLNYVRNEVKPPRRHLFTPKPRPKKHRSTPSRPAASSRP